MLQRTFAAREIVYYYSSVISRKKGFLRYNFLNTLHYEATQNCDPDYQPRLPGG